MLSSEKNDSCYFTIELLDDPLLEAVAAQAELATHDNSYITAAVSAMDVNSSSSSSPGSNSIATATVLPEELNNIPFGKNILFKHTRTGFYLQALNDFSVAYHKLQKESSEVEVRRVCTNGYWEYQSDIPVLPSQYQVAETMHIFRAPIEKVKDVLVLQRYVPLLQHIISIVQYSGWVDQIDIEDNGYIKLFEIFQDVTASLILWIQGHPADTELDAQFIVLDTAAKQRHKFINLSQSHVANEDENNETHRGSTLDIFERFLLGKKSTTNQKSTENGGGKVMSARTASIINSKELKDSVLNVRTDDSSGARKFRQDVLSNSRIIDLLIKFVHIMYILSVNKKPDTYNLLPASESLPSPSPPSRAENDQEMKSYDDKKDTNLQMVAAASKPTVPYKKRSFLLLLKSCVDTANQAIHSALENNKSILLRFLSTPEVLTTWISQRIHGWKPPVSAVLSESELFSKLLHHYHIRGFTIISASEMFNMVIKMREYHQSGKFHDAADIMDLITCIFTASEHFHTRSLDSVMYTILQIFNYSDAEKIKSNFETNTCLWFQLTNNVEQDSVVLPDFGAIPSNYPRVYEKADLDNEISDLIEFFRLYMPDNSGR